jgi:hypothetical protein
MDTETSDFYQPLVGQRSPPQVVQLHETFLSRVKTHRRSDVAPPTHHSRSGGMSGGERNEFYDLVKAHIDETGCSSFKTIQYNLNAKLGRRLLRHEQRIISEVISERVTFISQTPSSALNDGNALSHNHHIPQPIQSHEILICMAYSDDYTLGNICELIIRNYALKHGYQFLCQVLPYDEMMRVISPRHHCAWYKALLIRNLLNHFDLPSQPQPVLRDWKYLVWIDADALILNSNISIEDILSNNFHFLYNQNGTGQSLQSPPVVEQLSFPDLIISQDFSSTSSCPINTGVMIVQNTIWSQSLWEDVWSHPFCEKYHDVYFYDQSALIKCLKIRNIHFPSCLYQRDMKQSHVGMISRVQILPCCILNSNRICPNRVTQGVLSRGDSEGITEPTLSLVHLLDTQRSNEEGLDFDLSEIDKELTEGILLESDSSTSFPKDAHFIFHAVGKWNKMKPILRVCQLFNLIREEDLQRYCQSKGVDFRLYRGKCGGIPYQEKKVIL